MHMPPLSYQAVGVITPLALQLMVELGAFGAFAVALITEINGLRRSKAMPDKLGQQTGAMGVWLMLYTLVSAGGAAMFLMHAHADLMAPWLNNPLLTATMAGLVVVTAIFCLIYRWSWKALRQKRAPHLLLGVIGVLGALCTLAYGLAGKISVAQLPDGHVDVMAVDDLLKAASSGTLWTMLAQYAALALACAGGLGLLWLVLRRNRDDYGRDYYVFAAKACARWAGWAGLVGTVIFGVQSGLLWSSMTGSPYGEAFRVFSAAGVVLPLLGCLCWLPVARSAAPMRLKPAMILGVVLFWLGMAGMVAAQAHVLFLG